MFNTCSIDKIRGCLKRRLFIVLDFFLIYFVYFVEKLLRKYPRNTRKKKTKHKKISIIGSTFKGLLHPNVLP